MISIIVSFSTMQSLDGNMSLNVKSPQYYCKTLWHFEFLLQKQWKYACDFLTFLFLFLISNLHKFSSNSLNIIAKHPDIVVRDTNCVTDFFLLLFVVVNTLK